MRNAEPMCEAIMEGSSSRWGEGSGKSLGKSMGNTQVVCHGDRKGGADGELRFRKSRETGVALRTISTREMKRW